MPRPAAASFLVCGPSIDFREFPLGVRLASCEKQSLKEVQVYVRTGWGGFSGNHQGGVNDISQFVDLDLVSACACLCLGSIKEQ